jgi:hypothetical protein
MVSASARILGYRRTAVFDAAEYGVDVAALKRV